MILHLLARTPGLVLLCSALLLQGCGGGSGGSAATPSTLPSATLNSVAGSNAQTLVVDSGPSALSIRVVNLPYTSVRICVPGTTTCQTIDHVLVDTGSIGLRLLHSVLTIPLPATSISGKPLFNCIQFIDQSYMWGAVATADLRMGGTALDGEIAASLPVQVVGTPGSPAAPATCAPTGFSPNDSVDSLGANGILGIGHNLQDCGSNCAVSSNNGYYYLNNGGGTVVGTTASIGAQLQQPVSLFASNNNGTVMSLPGIAAAGASSATGTLVFGIGTQTNNAPGTTTKLTFNSQGYFSTSIASSTLNKGFIDSGSNGLFFGTSAYPTCSSTLHWYCPTSTANIQAINTGANGQNSTVSFSVANALDVMSNPSAYAINSLAGPIGDNVSFDFGLPFFFGRNVYTAISGRSTPLGNGPYVAY